MKNRYLFALLAGTLVLAPRAARAQGMDEESDVDAELEADAELGDEGLDATTSEDEADSGEETEGSEEVADEAAEEADDAKYDPHEAPDEGYWFMGMRFRNFVVPAFMINLFADGANTVNVFSAGPELTLRKAGFELDVSITTPYADYSMDDTIFKGKDDDDESYERVRSSLKVLYLTVDILKDIPLDQNGRVSFLIGGGVGFGGVFGDLERVQVFPDDPNNINPDDPSQWNDCPGPQPDPQNPANDRPFCDDSNDHYDGYTEPSWANGGSKPFLFPYLALPHLALRVKPIKQLQTRIDTGFSITGFYFGLAAGYALP